MQGRTIFRAVDGLFTTSQAGLRDSVNRVGPHCPVLQGLILAEETVPWTSPRNTSVNRDIIRYAKIRCIFDQDQWEFTSE